MKTMAYYFFKWHSRAQVLQARLFQPLPRTQGTKGQAVTPGKQTSPHTALGEHFPQSRTQVSPIVELKDRVLFSRFPQRSRAARSPGAAAALPVSPRWWRLLRPARARGTQPRQPRGAARAARCRSRDAVRWENTNFDDRSSGTMIQLTF